MTGHMVAIFVASFTVALLLSLVLTRCIRDAASRRGWVTAPSVHHIHRGAIPRLGGVAIFISFLLVTGLLSTNAHEFLASLAPRTLLWLLVSGSIVFLLGLYDDVYSAGPPVKFALQAFAASLLFFGGVGRFNLAAILGVHGLEWLALPLTIFWVLWITNAFNLIDGLDGLAAGSTLFSTLTLFIVSLISGNHAVALLALTLTGATIGFLRFNFNPASIFLGDCGSMLLGFMLSALALTGSQKTTTIIAVGIPVVSFGVPILDATVSVLRRYLSGQPLFTADCEHIHHKLMERGLTHRQVVILLYGASALCGLFSLVLLYPGGVTIAIVLVGLSLCIWAGMRHLGYHEFRELKLAAHRTMEQRRVITSDVAVRRATEKLAKVQDFLHLCWTLQEAFDATDFDAYHLCLINSRACNSRAEGQVLTEAKPAERCFAWYRPKKNTDTHESLEYPWTLSFELVTAKMKRGSFTLYRSQSDRPLLIDMNLLTSTFRVAFADAVYRLVDQVEADSASEGRPAKGGDLITTQAATARPADWRVYRPENIVEGQPESARA
jgi:UDP-GlcNAc:undecaprenyl-phosphate GlcNAc-1-phosphate transferase